MKKIDIEKFKQLFDVSAEGELVWKVARGNGVKPGDKAGTINKLGYVQVYVNNVPYYAHRIVLALHLGRDVGKVDHVDGCRSNNCVSNLRELSSSDNAKNRVGKGYINTPWGWQASITNNYKSICLGTFATEAEAKQAYLEAKQKYHKSAEHRLKVLETQ